MKVLLKDVVASYPAINEIKKGATKDADLAYDLGALSRSIREKVELFDEVKAQLFRQYGEPVEGADDQWRVKEEYLDEFRTQWKALADKEEEINLDSPFTTAQLNAAGIEVTGEMLEPLIGWALVKAKKEAVASA